MKTCDWGKFREIAIEIVEDIFRDACDRRDCDLGCIGEDIQHEIKKEWRQIVLRNIK